PVIKDVIQKTLSADPKYKEPPNKTSHPHINIVSSGIGEDRGPSPKFFKRFRERLDLAELIHVKLNAGRMFTDEALSSDEVFLSVLNDFFESLTTNEELVLSFNNVINEEIPVSEQVSILFNAFRTFEDYAVISEVLSAVFKKYIEDLTESSEQIAIEFLRN